MAKKNNSNTTNSSVVNKSKSNFSGKNRKVDSKLITFDVRYHPDVSYQRVKKLSKEFDVNKVSPICVSKRDDGKYYIIDGVTTFFVLQEVFGDKPVTCTVYNGLTLEEEALLFVAKNTKRWRPLPGEITKADIVGGVQEDIDYKNLLDQTNTPYTWRVVGTKDTRLCCHAFMKKKIRELGTDCVKKALELIISANMDSDPIAYKVSFIGGLLQFLSVYSDDIDDNHLRNNLLKVGVAEIKANAQNYANRAGYVQLGRLSISKYFGMAFVDAYNYKLRPKQAQLRLDPQKIIDRF